MRKECPLCGKSLKWKWVQHLPDPDNHYICPRCGGKIQRSDLQQGLKRGWSIYVGLAVVIVAIWALHVPAMLALSMLGAFAVVNSAYRWYRERNIALWVPHQQQGANNSLQARLP